MSLADLPVADAPRLAAVCAVLGLLYRERNICAEPVETSASLG